MPTPTPIALGDIGRFTNPDWFDCIKCDPFTPPFDAQRYRGAGDSKLLWTMPDLYPFKLLVTSSAGWKELQSSVNRDYYWSLIGWGGAATFAQVGGVWGTSGSGGYWDGNRFFFGGPVYYHQWLYSMSMADYLDPLDDKGVGGYMVHAMQILSPFTLPRNYEIWRVTARTPLILSYADAGVDYAGFAPPGNADIWTASPPWWASSDWAFVSSGTINPKQTLIINPHDTAPKLNTQIPPAGCLSDGVTPSANNFDWCGWGVVTFLVWV